MKAEIKIAKEVEVKTILIEAEVRYIGDDDDDDMASNFPLIVDGKEWVATVDIDSGKIHGWPKGESHKAYCKVCDAGSYTLFDGDGVELSKIDNDYVPNGVIPGEYGDYIDLTVDGDGFIKDWPRYPDLSAFPGFGEGDK